MGFENWDFPVRALGAVTRLSGLGDFTPKEFAGEMGMRGPFQAFRAKYILKRLQEVYLVGHHWAGWFIPENIMTRALDDAELCLNIGDNWMTCNETLGLHCKLDGPGPMDQVRAHVREEYTERIESLEKRLDILEEE